MGLIKGPSKVLIKMEATPDTVEDFTNVTQLTVVIVRLIYQNIVSEFENNYKIDTTDGY